MINPEILKKNPEIIKKSLEKREIKIDIDEIREIYIKLGKTKNLLDNLRAQKKSISKEIGIKVKGGENVEELIEKSKNLDEEIKKLEEEYERLNKEYFEKIYLVPNLVSDDVPLEEPKVVKVWGEPREDFVPPHWEMRNVFSEELGAKLSGSGFSVMLEWGARLERALINFMIDTHIKYGYKEFFTPYLVKEDIMIGTGHLPKFKDDMYSGDGLFLIPTAEVSLVGLFRDEIIPIEKLPIKCVAYSACFRKEAGSWGKETRGLIRQHQFNKVELVKITSPESSDDELLSLVEDAERILQLLELPYRVVLLPANDMGFASSKTYDIEVWMPGMKKYVEISSCSNCRDFQARRSLIRIKRRDGKIEYAHTLNGSGVAIGRCLSALLENHFKNHKILIPQPLQEYLKIKEIEV